MTHIFTSQVAERFGTLFDPFDAPAVRLPEHRHTQSGFTLVELLVVIAIISLLAALLMPAIGNAKAGGQATKCASNMKSLAIAMLAYAADHEGDLPMSDNATMIPTPTISWDDRISGYDGRPALTETEMLGGAFSPQKANLDYWNNIYRCPSETYRDIHDPNRLLRTYSVPRNHGLWLQSDGGDGLPNGLWGAYSRNGTTHYWSANLAHVPFPSTTLLLVELRQTWMVLGSVVGGWAVDTPIPFASNSQLDPPSGHPNLRVARHHPSWNYLFCDGSVRRLEPMSLVVGGVGTKYWGRRGVPK